MTYNQIGTWTAFAILAMFNWSGLILFVGVVESSAAEEKDEEGGGGGDDGKEEVNEVLEAEDINELDQPGETSE